MFIYTCHLNQQCCRNRKIVVFDRILIVLVHWNQTPTTPVTCWCNRNTRIFGNPSLPLYLQARRWFWSLSVYNQMWHLIPQPQSGAGITQPSCLHLCVCGERRKELAGVLQWGCSLYLYSIIFTNTPLNCSNLILAHYWNKTCINYSNKESLFLSSVPTIDQTGMAAQH